YLGIYNIMNIILARLTRARETRRGGHGHLATPKCPISLNRRVAIPSIDAWRSPPSVNTPRGVGGKTTAVTAVVAHDRQTPRGRGRQGSALSAAPPPRKRSTWWTCVVIMTMQPF